MPAKAVTVTATYKPIPPATYALTVVKGSGSGPYAEGATVNITADPPAGGQEFDTWISDGGVIFASDTSAATSFTMPAKAVTVTATYKPTTPPAPPVAPSETNDIISFTLAGVTGIIDGTNITVGLPAGTNVTNLDPVITHSGVSIDPASGAPRDFTNPVTYTVTAESGAVKTYTVTVTVAVPPVSSAHDITLFTLAGSAGTIDHKAGTITVTVPAGTDITKLAPAITHNGVSIDPASGAPRDFTNPVTYTVTAEDGGTKAYTVTVTVAGSSLLNGWHYLKAERVWKYYVNSVAKTGWLYDARNWYFLDYTDGHMLVGWQYDKNYKSWFYLAGNGKMKTGWFYDNSDKAWYFFIGDGTMKLGWEYDKQYKAWFYFAGDGAMAVNNWIKYKGGRYYLGGNGKMLTGKRSIGGRAYTFKANGVWVR
jgi:hypothetical protein